MSLNPVSILSPPEIGRNQRERPLSHLSAAYRYRNKAITSPLLGEKRESFTSESTTANWRIRAACVGFAARLRVGHSKSPLKKIKEHINCVPVISYAARNSPFALDAVKVQYGWWSRRQITGFEERLLAEGLFWFRGNLVEWSFSKEVGDLWRGIIMSVVMGLWDWSRIVFRELFLLFAIQSTAPLRKQRLPR